MNADRIKEIQSHTAYPNSVSVASALLKVWNECEQDKTARFGKDFGETITVGDILRELDKLPNTDEFCDKFDELVFNGSWPEAELGFKLPRLFQNDIRGLVYSALHRRDVWDSPVAVEYCECKWPDNPVAAVYADRYSLLEAGDKCECGKPINPTWQWQQGDPVPTKMPVGLEIQFPGHDWEPCSLTWKVVLSSMNDGEDRFRWNILENQDVFEPVAETQHCDSCASLVCGGREEGPCQEYKPQQDDGRKVYKLRFDNQGTPYFDLPAWRTRPHHDVWAGHQIDGVAYTRAGFLFNGDTDDLDWELHYHWIWRDQQADRIVFVRVKEVDGEQQTRKDQDND